MSELKGDLSKPKVPEETRLKGTLAGKQEDVLGIGSSLIQRDSGAVFTVEKVIKTKHNPEGLVIMKGPEGQTVNLRLNDLREKLSQDDGPWKR